MQFQRVFGQVFGLETAIAATVFGLVLAAMIIAFVASWRRRRRGNPPSRRASRNRLEIGYALALTGMAIFLIITSFSANASFFRDSPPDMTVKVIAFQWCWDFQYPAQSVNVTAECRGKGTPTLVLPAGRPVRIEMTSNDVIHSFWVPGIRFKMDIFPHHVNSFTVTLHDGRWVGHCAELCGIYHDEMMFHLQAVPPAQFDRWIRARQTQTAKAANS